MSRPTTVRRMRSTLLALAAAALAAAAPAQAVVGGSAAAEGEFPFMVSLQTSGHFCGGTVIAPRWVLTAAHSLDSSIGVRAVIGRADLTSSRGERIRVASVTRHPEYRSVKGGYDVALLRLDQPTKAPAIVLAGARDDGLEAPGTRVTTIGWGDQTPTLGLNSTSRLQKVDVDVVSDQDCGLTEPALHEPTAVCAEDLLKDSCNGDSGGPLFAARGGRRIQVGVVSYGTSCAVPKFPGVYSEVNNPAIRAWITQIAGV